MESTELYRFSSLVPKVKKSIKKYKKTYNGEFLSKVWKVEQGLIAPPRYIQPINIYRFYGDIVTVDNPLCFCESGSEGCIHQLSLHMNYKSISRIDVSDTLCIHLEDKFSKDYYPIDLFIDRLNSLGQKDAHELAESFSMIREHCQIKENEGKFCHSNSEFGRIFNLNEVLSQEELVRYQESLHECQDELKKRDDTYTFCLRKFFYKKEPYRRFGPVLDQIRFNQKAAQLFLNKKIEQCTYQDAIEMLNISANLSSEYYQFFNGMIQHGKYDCCDYNCGVETIEGCYMPCREHLKKITFIGNDFEEMNFFLTISIDSKLIEGLCEKRRLKHLEDMNKINVARAKLKTKFKKIENIDSDSWKTLCVLYYGNAESDDKDENNGKQEDFAKRFWDSVDQTKVCKYRLIRPE